MSKSLKMGKIYETDFFLEIYTHMDTHSIHIAYILSTV